MWCVAGTEGVLVALSKMGFSLTQNPICFRAMITLYFFAFRLSSNSLQARTSLCSRDRICLVSKISLESIEFGGMEWEQQLPPRGPGGDSRPSVTLTVRGSCQGQVRPPSRRAMRRGRAGRSSNPPGWKAVGSPHRKSGAPSAMAAGDTGTPPARRSGSCRHLPFHSSSTPCSRNPRMYKQVCACDSQAVNFGDFNF